MITGERCDGCALRCPIVDDIDAYAAQLGQQVALANPPQQPIPLDPSA